MDKKLYALTEAEYATVLAALRCYQQNMLMNGGDPPFDVAEIATSCDTITPLSADDIDGLCEGMNHEGLDIGEVVNVLGVKGENLYVEAARHHSLVTCDRIVLDDQPVVSVADSGAHVMAWLWIDNELVGLDDVPTGMQEG